MQTDCFYQESPHTPISRRFLNTADLMETEGNFAILVTTWPHQMGDGWEKHL